MDEVFGDKNYVSEIVVKKKGSQISGALEPVNDFILMYAKQIANLKFRRLWLVREDEEIFEDFPFVELRSGERLRISDLGQRDQVEYQSNFRQFKMKYPDARLFGLNPLKSGGFRKNQSRDFEMHGRTFPIGDGQCWKHTVISEDNETPGMTRLNYADRLFPLNRDVRFVRYSPVPSIKQMSNWWDGLGGAPNQVYVVQTNVELVKRCILMTTDPGDLVLDPTCGSGTTAFVAEQWGRRWITIDTSRVAIALARSRLMGARYPYYLLADSAEGQRKEGEIMRAAPKTAPTRNDIRLGFVYERARSGTSGAIANNAEIDVIWERAQVILEPLLADLNAELGTDWREWEVPREATNGWPAAAKAVHSKWWEARTVRQKDIDASIAAKAEFEYLYDKPYPDNSRVRVAGPFTVELDRDAALGISEYAPGAEVVAGGRIWVSAGIARYPREFMPTRYYRACDRCNHVQVADARPDLVQSCPNCGSPYTAPVRPCLEPLGFVTSITERDGRDPGVSRLRARPADEARLITMPRGDLFCEGDVPGVRFAHMSGSPRPDTLGMEGRLVVINRGPRGTGFLRCIRCEHAESAPRAFALQKVSAHKAPRTGEACPGSDATLQVSGAADRPGAFLRDRRGPVEVCAPAPRGSGR